MLYRRAKHTLLVFGISLLLFGVITKTVAEEIQVVDNEINASNAIQNATNKAMSLPRRSLRLPNSTYPLSYQLHISSNLHLADFRFNGNVTIDIQIRESTNEIVLHAKNFSDVRIKVRSLDTNEIVDDLTHTYLNYASFLIIHPHENYQAFEQGQRYRVEILYSDLMQDRTVGLYWMKYVNEATNRSVYIAATQSEPTYARLVFPCYDEPAFKSNFTIRLTHGSNYIAISNMPVQETQRHGDENDVDALTTTTFYATLPMSTYLVAFVISDFEHISEEYRGVTQRVFTSPNTKDKGQQALKNAVLTVAALEDYFGIKYPLAKLDHIALQKNYGSAMENWGLITYKEDCLLFPENADVYKKIKDIITQSHEIAHQWFGNLVSPVWWTYAWMNEGFATYFSYVISNILYPEHKIMEFFMTDIAESAYSYNAMSVRPMSFYVEKESRIMEVFDIVSYKRAACVIKMFHHAFDQKTFIRAISRFLRKFEYTVADELQLFDTIQAVLQEDSRFQQQPWLNSVREIMLSWTHSKWIPIVAVTRNYEAGTITFRQRSTNRVSYENWWIPLNFATTHSPDFESTQVDYFMPPLTEVTLSLQELGLQLNAADWLIVNKQQTGFFHVLYDTENLQAIARQLQENHTVIHVMNRAAIFQDLAPLIEHNEMESIDIVFELLKYLEHEEELMPWNLVADTIHFLEQNLFGTASHALFKQFVRRLIAPTFRRLYNSPEQMNITNSEMRGRQKIIEMACMADLKECLDYTYNLAHKYFFENVKLHIDMDYYAMYDTVLCLGVKYLNDEEFNTILEFFSKSDRNSEYYDDVIYALRCTQDRSHMRQYLNLLLGENSTHLIMNDNDSMMYLFYLYKSNMAARSVVWNFFEHNYQLLCRSSYFVENFNRIAEYIPHEHRSFFQKLHFQIAQEKAANKNDDTVPLIDVDSKHIGKKIHASELFREKFEHQIHNWLLTEQPQINIASPYGARNGSERLSSIFKMAGFLVKRVIGTI